jgi:hypothetical protein
MSVPSVVVTVFQPVSFVFGSQNQNWLPGQYRWPAQRAYGVLRGECWRCEVAGTAITDPGPPPTLWPQITGPGAAT